MRLANGGPITAQHWHCILLTITSAGCTKLYAVRQPWQREFWNMFGSCKICLWPQQNIRERWAMDNDEKDALELRKLALEIAEMERSWWKRPTYILAALPTLLAVIALSVGFVNGYFSAQLTKLENQRHDIELQVKEVKAVREQITKEIQEESEKLAKIQEEFTKLQEGLTKTQLSLGNIAEDQGKRKKHRRR